MPISDVMTWDVATCAAGDTVREAALKMKNEDCGLIPVLEKNESGSPIGVLTDRDITCRVVAGGRSPDEVVIRDVMSKSVITIHYKAQLNAAMRLMEQHNLRRLIVTGDTGELRGVISLTDLTRTIGREKLGEVIQKVSHQRRPGMG